MKKLSRIFLIICIIAMVAISTVFAINNIELPSEYVKIISSDSTLKEKRDLKEMVDEAYKKEQELDELWNEITKHPAYIGKTENYLSKENDDKTNEKQISLKEQELTTEYSFEIFSKELKDNLSELEMMKIEDLYNQAMELEILGKSDTAKVIWDKLTSMDIWK